LDVPQLAPWGKIHMPPVAKDFNPDRGVYKLPTTATPIELVLAKAPSGAVFGRLAVAQPLPLDELRRTPYDGHHVILNMR
jgi:hypothetical protein